MCRSNLASGSRSVGGGQKPAQAKENLEPTVGSQEHGEPLFQQQQFYTNIIYVLDQRLCFCSFCTGMITIFVIAPPLQH